MATAGLDDLLVDLYACPTDVGRWPAVLDAVSAKLGAHSTVVQVLSPEGRRLRTHWIARDSVTEAARQVHEAHFPDSSNPRLELPDFLPERPRRTIVRDADLFLNRQRELAETRERLAAIGLGHFVSAGIPLSGDRSIVVALHRHADDPREFANTEEVLLEALVPHLRQTFLLAEQFGQMSRHADRLEQSLNRIHCAAVVCDADGRVRWQNRGAAELLANHRSLHVQQQRLMASTAEDRIALTNLLLSTAKTAPERTGARSKCLLLDAGLAPPLQVMAQPLAHELADGEETQVLVLLSPGQQRPQLRAEAISRLFGLSLHEARLAVALCAGTSLKDYAQQHGITEGTARFQLKQVLAKTGTRRQADLVSQLCSSVAAQAAPWDA